MSLIKHLAIASAMLFCLSARTYSSNEMEVDWTEAAEAFKEHLVRTWQRHDVLPEELNCLEVKARPNQPEIHFEVTVSEEFHEKYLGAVILGQLLLEKYQGKQSQSFIPKPSSIDIDELLDREKYPSKGRAKILIVYRISRY